MKITSRVLALVLALATVFTLMGCHQKNETVLTVDGVDIPSGLYIAFQMEGFGAFMNNVNSDLSASSNASGITKYADYFNHHSDGKSAEEFINEKALATAIEYVLVEKKFAEYGLEIDKSEAEYIESYAKYYWDNQDKTFYESNGVGYESYKELMTFRSKRGEIFEYYYNKKNAETGKGGLYTVPDADIIKALGENYVLADTLTIDLVPSSETGITEYTADQIATFKADIQSNVDKYNKGTSFAEIYKGVYGQEPQSNVNETGDVKTIYPKSAGVYSVNSNDVTLYNLLKNKTKEDTFQYGKAYLVGTEADKVFSMAVIYDITKDPYYLEQYRSDILYLLKDEEFTAKLAEEGKSLAVNKNTKLVDFYKPTNLDYDAAEEAAQQ